MRTFHSTDCIVNANNGYIEISGLEENEIVSFYSLDGQMLGKQTSNNGIVQLSTFEKFVIAKVGKSSIKISVR